MKLDISLPFALYADCYIEYDGRAYSQLERGNYLIISKSDKSVLVHGSDKIPPRNYQGKNSKLEYADGCLIVRRKSEIIKITIYNIISIQYLDNWSSKEIAIFKTEADLVNKLVTNIKEYISDEIVEIIREYKTNQGPIDVAVKGAQNLHFIEVKRNAISTTNIYQLKKYIDGVGEKVKAYIAGPKIRDNAMQICNQNNIEYLEVKF